MRSVQWADRRSKARQRERCAVTGPSDGIVAAAAEIDASEPAGQRPRSAPLMSVAKGLMRLRPDRTVVRQGKEESPFAFGSHDCLSPLGRFLSRED